MGDPQKAFYLPSEGLLSTEDPQEVFYLSLEDPQDVFYLYKTLWDFYL